MWSSISFLQALTSWSLVVALVTGIVAAGAGFISGLAGSRLNDLEKAAHEREIEAMRLRAAELEKRTAELNLKTAEMRNDVDFAIVASMS